MTSESEKTMKLVTNLDRKAIEAQARRGARRRAGANLKELADMFNGIEGMPRAQIEAEGEERAQVARRQAAAQPHRLAARAGRPQPAESEVTAGFRLRPLHDRRRLGRRPRQPRLARLRRQSRDRRGRPLRRHLRQRRLHPEEAVLLRRAFPRGFRDRARLRLDRRASRASTGRRCSRTRTARSRA